MKNLTKKAEIVTYHNDLNKLNLSSLSAVQHNILMKLLLKYKDKGDETFYFNLKDFEKLIGVSSNRTINEIQLIGYEFFMDLFKIDYSPIMPADAYYEEHINLFDNIRFYYDQKIDYIKTLPKNERISHLKAFEIGFSKTFQYIINQNFENYTSHELGEFISLKRVGAKILYKLLKQNQHYGKLEIEWLEYCRLNGYLDTNTLKLKKAVGDIGKEFAKDINEIQNLRSVFGDETFKDLKTTKIYKGLDTGKGGKTIDSLFFEFKARKRRNKTLANTLYNIKNEVESLAGYEVKTHIIPKKIIVNNTPKN